MKTIPTPWTGLPLQELYNAAAAAALPKYRARQYAEAVYKHGAQSWNDITTWPKSLRSTMSTHAPLISLTPLHTAVSQNSPVVKYLWKLHDGATTESVVIGNQRTTFCISTQVGCPVQCRFCASGIRGFQRNLETHEIVEQVLIMSAQHAHPDNIVIMGMGEPFLNYDNLMQALSMLNDPVLFNLGARRITVSTSGIIEGIYQFAQHPKQFNLAVSLHTVDDALRSELVPIARQNPLKKLKTALYEYQRLTKRRITIEYVLLNEINDSPEQAEALSTFFDDLSININLIPYNACSSLPYTAPKASVVSAFLYHLKKNNINVTLRKEQGSDIAAACGQLKQRYS